MHVRVLEITKARKSSYLAGAKVELSDDNGTSIVIDDLRILRNRQDQLWLAPPTYSTANGKAWEYRPVIQFDRELKRQIEDAVLAEYERQTQGVRP